MKVTVLGAGGMLGSDLLPVWRESATLDSYTHSQCDAANREQVKSVLEKSRPDLVLHLAAATDVDRCQTDRRYAYLNNTISSTIVAQECSRIGAGIVYMSSIAVFDGEKTEPYTEFDRTVPVNIYGESKLQGEREIALFCPKHWIFRTGWLFGGSGHGIAHPRPPRHAGRQAGQHHGPRAGGVLHLKPVRAAARCQGRAHLLESRNPN